MNYAKIYDDLIEHRKMLPKIAGEYYEKHHIIPRCKGGTNKKDNLIFLTAEDHFVAHLLLAKAYGGVDLWRAVQAMCMSRKMVNRVVKTRRSFAIARKNFGLSQRDETKYEFRHIATGEVFFATMTNMQDWHDFDRRHIHQLIRGVANTAKGFCLASTVLPEEERHTFIHVPTGERHTGTAKEMFTKHGMYCYAFWNLLRGTAPFHKGYISASAPADLIHFYTSPYVIKNIDTGELHTGTLSQIMSETGLSKSKLSRLTNGHTQRAENYVLVSSPAIDTGRKFLSKQRR